MFPKTDSRHQPALYLLIPILLLVTGLAADSLLAWQWCQVIDNCCECMRLVTVWRKLMISLIPLRFATVEYPNVLDDFLPRQGGFPCYYECGDSYYAKQE